MDEYDNLIKKQDVTDFCLKKHSKACFKAPSDSCDNPEIMKKIFQCRYQEDIKRREQRLKRSVSKSLSTKVGDKKGVPLGIAVSADFLSGGRDLLSKGGRGNRFSPITADVYTQRKGVLVHAMAIVGKRCVDGKIQYQVQNSMGKSCALYQKKGQKFFECDKETGSFWVGEEKLIKNLVATSALSSSKGSITPMKKARGVPNEISFSVPTKLKLFSNGFTKKWNSKSPCQKDEWLYSSY